MFLSAEHFRLSIFVVFFSDITTRKQLINFNSRPYIDLTLKSFLLSSLLDYKNDNLHLSKKEKSISTLVKWKNESSAIVHLLFIVRVEEETITVADAS